MNTKEFRKIITTKKYEGNTDNITLSEIEKDCREYLQIKIQQDDKEYSTNQLEDIISNYINDNIAKWNIKSFQNEGKTDKVKLTEIVVNDLLNFGPIQEALNDENVTEIAGEGRWLLKVDTKGRSSWIYNSLGERAKWNSPEDQESVFTKLFLGSTQTTGNNEFRIVNGRTIQGFRLSITHWSATSRSDKRKDENGYSDFTLRKFKDSSIPIETLIKGGTLCDQMGKMLKFLVGNVSYAIIGSTGSGKAQSLDSLVLTPNGFIKIRDIKENQEIIAGNGHISKVLKVFYQGKRDIYKINFEDGTCIEVADNHLNSVFINNKDKEVLETKELIEQFKNGDYIEVPCYKRDNKVIKSIVYKDYEECKCIYIEDECHEYITDNYVITHNTTLNRSLLTYIPDMLKVICIQQPTEIDLRKYDGQGQLINNRLMWEADEDAKSKDITGAPLKYTSTLNNLMTQTLRNTPDIISINEVRHPDECASAVLIGQAGHIVNLTFHAKDPFEGCSVFTNKLMTYTGQTYEVGLMDTTQTFNFMICQVLMADGSRKITRISEIIGVDPTNRSQPLINDIYVYKVTGRDKDEKGNVTKIYGEHKKVGMLSEKLREQLSYKGYIEEDFKILDPDIETFKATYEGKA